MKAKTMLRKAHNSLFVSNLPSIQIIIEKIAGLYVDNLATIVSKNHIILLKNKPIS
jgi:hypothetical protein